MRERNRHLIVPVLFLGFRVALLAFWPAGQLARWSDYDYYYEIAQWVDKGLLPYLHYWVEYPPLFPFLSALLYLLTPHFEAYAAALALVQLAFETGSLLLLHRVARRLLGEARAERVMWTYALLFAPVATWWLSFDAITTFFLLLAVERWLAGRRLQSAIAVGAGALVKWFPLLFLPVAIRFRRSWREAAAYAALAVVIFGLVLGTLGAIGPQHTLASLRSLGGRTSWQTVWALLDGNLGTGAYHADRLNPSAAALPQGNPARVPHWIVTVVFGVIYVWLWRRPPGPHLPQSVLRLASTTVLVFFLWSRGWSPQWLGMLAPLLLVCLPLERAALYLIVLTFVNLAEWPVLLSRGLGGWLYLTVLVRSALFVLVLADLVSRQRASSVPSASS
jgi:hypothetical protein